MSPLVLGGGGGGQCFFRFEPFPDLSTHACQIWSWSDGHVKKKGAPLQTDRKTHTHFRDAAALVETVIIIVSRHDFNMPRVGGK